MNAKIPVFVFLGPTAAGKTAFLFDWFTGRDAVASAEIVSADSMQVYRGMDIGTAKPDGAARAALPHHLLDLRDPDEQFNAGEFVRLADECCAEIYARGKLPVVTGGTGFYLKNFIHGLPDSPPGSESIRQEIKRERDADGAETLYAELQKNDPEAAARIHANDVYRIIRALEVVRLTGKPLSAFEAENAEKKKARSQKYDFLIIGLARNREELYARINARVDMMFEQGLYGEVRALFEKGYTPNDPGMRAIGYREFFVAREDDDAALGREPDRRSHYALVPASNTEGARMMIKQNSRHYAKRQETFFKGIAQNRRFVIGPDGDRESEVKEAAASLVSAFWSGHRA
ncbi:MAG: tRNA (adenosine(37)-N6)-dimethylallyltransferase MiaA [Spirochaetaceae bacterium]|nr:tRNA (adenosine(37)-N6)-dimethylallyltransferase MiaA [Spirochaetaceae bacterium]